ncbi:MAG: gamma carbonic anhydrase family protein [Isosphaeraceae bacterium]
MIDPSAFLARGVIVLGRVSIGPDSSIWYQTVIRGDTERIRIGASTNIQDLCMVHADPGFPCEIGDRVTVGHRAILHGCTIEDGCIIGMGAILLNGSSIGAGSIIGAGSVVPEGMRIPAGSLVLGVPGKVARPVSEEAIGRIDHAWKHYVEQARIHRAGQFPIEDPS